MPKDIGMNNFTQEGIKLHHMPEIIRQIKYHAGLTNINDLVKKVLDDASWGITEREIDNLLFLCEVSRNRINGFNKFLVELKISMPKDM